MIFQTITENFELLLFSLLCFTAFIWFYDLFWLSKNRKRKARSDLSTYDLKTNSANFLEEKNKLEHLLSKPPSWIEYTGGFFPVILIVFSVRAFIYEPFKIPSESMLPTLFTGDYILVNKFDYGIRLPILGTKILELGSPKRGDVMVFKFPENTKQNYIKRVIGLPGDKIEYKNKTLKINGVELKIERINDFLHEGVPLNFSEQYKESISQESHKILLDENQPSYVNILEKPTFPHVDNCKYDEEGVVCKVPEDHYFMLGDNRDRSLDSRYWGFVPESLIVGRAFYIWFNASKLSRIGSFIY